MEALDRAVKPSGALVFPPDGWQSGINALDVTNDAASRSTLDISRIAFGDLGANLSLGFCNAASPRTPPAYDPPGRRVCRIVLRRDVHKFEKQTSHKLQGGDAHDFSPQRG